MDDAATTPDLAAVLWRNGNIVQAESCLDFAQARAAAERLAKERADA